MNFSAPIQRGIGASIITVVIYLTVVVISTPSLRPLDAIVISVTLNWWLIGGIAAGTGIQTFLLAYAKSIACSVKYKGTVLGASGFFSGLSSFLSFLSLIPVGCCGTWIYVLSFLPGLVGASASGFLLGNSLQLEVLGLVLMALSVVYTYLSIRSKLAASISLENRTHRKTHYLVPLILIAVIALGSETLVTAYAANLQPRLFKGAYFAYSGTTSISGLGPVNSTRTYQVLDFNTTAVKMLITSQLGKIQLQAISWEPYSTYTRLHTSGEVFVKVYTATLLLNGKMYRDLIADVYSEGNSTTTYYYISGTAAFPIEIVTNAGYLTVELTLVSTNTHSAG